jgi:ribosome recycling factor
MLDDIVKNAEARMQKSLEHLQTELASIRTGRASVSLLDRIQVDYYGTPTPVNQVATVTAPDPRLVVVQPWEKSMLAVIEKAILKSDVGITPTNDGQVLRLAVPQPTADRRKEMAKQVHQRAEESRVAMRNLRRDAVDQIKKAEHDKENSVSEDESRRAQERLQKLTDQFVKQIDEVSKKKETEVMEV